MKNAAAAKAVAAREAVPFLHLHSISVAQHNQVGLKETATYNYGETDRTHFGKIGADVVAGLVI